MIAAASGADSRTTGGEASLARRVRWKLLAWSGGSTLVVLLVLGSLLYVTVATSLAEAATEQLRDRAALMIRGLAADRAFVEVSPARLTPNAAQPGVVIGGATSGTIGTFSVPTAEGVPIAAPFPGIASDELAADAETAIATGRDVVRTISAGDAELRTLTVPIATPLGAGAVQIVADRSAEERTLGVLLRVLVAGGIVAVLASLGVGWVYADRALVPIRESMRRQREFAADASHELRTPLAIIQGSVEHLRRHPGERVADVGDVVDDLAASSGQLTTLVDDLLLLARTDSGAADLAVADADLGDIVLDATGRFAPLAAERGIELRVDAEPVPLRGDPARLSQLVTILVDNAVRHTEAHGGHAVEVGVRSRDGRGVVIVEDEGPGVRPADRERIFERFWRAADAPAGGTGLGLAIASWIAERHGGTIAVSNRLTGGARFEVRLPGLRDVAREAEA